MLDEQQIYLFAGVTVAAFVLVLTLLLIANAKVNRRLRENNEQILNNIYSGCFIYFEDFEKDWISMRQGRNGLAGYKYSDGPGCYVITIYSYPVLDGNFMNYENIYIGQSVNICQRVHNHFTGKGKGDIYADIKYGKYVYVQFVPCDASYMNTMEKELIQAFDATSSYNRTRGGGRNRNMQGWY